MNASEHRILVVDDDARNMMFMRSLLSNEGYQLFEASNGEEAVETAERENPDVILLDVMMPVMDGFEACRRIRAHPKLNQVPIILLTALDDRDSRLEGLEAGADDFLSKPFDSTELLIRLRTIARLNRFRRVAEERARFEQVVSLSPDGIVIIDSAGIIRLANREFARIGGLRTPEEARGQNFFDWLTTPDALKLRQSLASLVAEERSPSVEVHFDADETALEPLVAEISSSPIPWAGDKAVQLVVRDVSEKKRLESQVMRFQRIELLGELAGSVAHDMNNVLSAVSGNLALIGMQETLSNEAQSRMATIQQSVQRGNGILRQLLAFTRGSDGTLQDVDLGSAIREVVDLITPMMKYDYKIEVSVSENLPIVQADPNQIHQVLMNLCVNARDAMTSGGTLHLVALSIHIDETEAEKLGPDASAGDFVVLHVRDNGSGIPPEVRARIFTPFFTTKAPGKGTGLGLATVMRLVRRHRGFISVESTVGQGTCFSVYLPCAS